MKKLMPLVLSLLIGLVACTSKPKDSLSKEEFYTCSMHPQVMQHQPGNCPICHMQLVLAKGTSSAPNEIMLNDEQIRLGNIKTDTVRKGMIGDEIVLTATLNTDEAKVNSISARIMGRVDHLYFKNLGDYVPKGAHLYDLYSEELNNAKQEFIAVVEKQQTLDHSIIDFNRLVQSAKTKLLLWGMSEAQVAELEKTKKASALTSFFSQVSGYITELPISEGQYVSEGTTLMKLADLSTLWAEAQVYASQLSEVDQKGFASVRVSDFPGKEWRGKISFANPEIAPDSRLNLLRIEVPNANALLRPGMSAYVAIKNKSMKTFTLPNDAVLRDEKSNSVWVSTGKNRFKMKMVETGLETGDRIEIKSGIEDGEIVVISGAYLLQSEFIFKKGANTMEGMDMGGHQH